MKENNNLKKIIVLTSLYLVMLFTGCETEYTFIDDGIYGWRWIKLWLPSDIEIVDMESKDFNHLTLHHNPKYMHPHNNLNCNDTLCVYYIPNNTKIPIYNWFTNDSIGLSYADKSIVSRAGSVDSDNNTWWWWSSGEYVEYYAKLKISQSVRYYFDKNSRYLTKIQFYSNDYGRKQHQLLWDGPRIITPLKDYLENNAYVVDSSDATHIYYSKNGFVVKYQLYGDLDELGYYGETIEIER